MPGFYYSQALHRSRHVSFLHFGALHYLPGSLYVFFPPCCPRPSGYRGRLRSAFLFSPRPLLSRGAPLLHGSMTDCLIAGENRAGLLLNSSAPSFPARFLPALRRAALPPGQPPRLLYHPCCPRPSDRLVFPVTIHGLTESHLKRSYLRSASHMPGHSD